MAFALLVSVVGITFLSHQGTISTVVVVESALMPCFIAFATCDPSDIAIVNGTLSGTGCDTLAVNENDVCTHVCDSGYTLVGTAVRTCQASTSFDGTSPSCQGPQLESLQALSSLTSMTTADTDGCIASPCDAAASCVDTKAPGTGRYARLLDLCNPVSSSMVVAVRARASQATLATAKIAFCLQLPPLPAQLPLAGRLLSQ